MAVKAPRGNGKSRERNQSGLPAPGEKSAYVREMFDAIAPRYDLLNSVLSARLHHRWRRFAAREAALGLGDTALDVCTGTGDLAFELARFTGPSGRVVATDFSAPMLRLGDRKRTQRGDANAETVRFLLADAETLPFSGNSFDAVTVGFGIRNVASIERALGEMVRVARPGGRVVLLEFNQPQNAVFAALYRAYSFRFLPIVGGLLSGRRTAYEYLPSSIRAFPSREAIAEQMRGAGLVNVRYADLMFGTVVVHRGIKGRKD